MCDPLLKVMFPRTYLRTVVANRHNDAVRVGYARNVARDETSGRVQHQPQPTKVARYVLKRRFKNENGRRWGHCGVFVLCNSPQVHRCDVLFVCDNINRATPRVYASQALCIQGQNLPSKTISTYGTVNTLDPYGCRKVLSRDRNGFQGQDNNNNNPYQGLCVLRGGQNCF